MMKGKLYIKIFLSFLVLLIISEVLIFGIFHIVKDDTIHDEIMRNLDGSVGIFKEIAEEKIGKNFDPKKIENSSIDKFLKRLNRGLDLNIWLELPGGAVKNYADINLPDVPDDELNKFESFSYIFKRSRHDPFIFVKMPVEFPGKKKGNIYIKHRLRLWFPEGRFFIGLLIIGFTLALLLYPFSRFITTPLKKLTAIADRISHGDLSQRVRVKSRDEIGQLAESFNRMAETLEGMINGTKELTTNISHELRSPLTRIRMAQEILADKAASSDPDIEKLIVSMKSEIEEMDDLIGKVLLLTKLDLSDNDLKYERINISDLIQEIADRYKVTLEEKSIALELSVLKDFEIIAVKENIRAALSNVIDNAVKYTENRGRIRIALSERGSNIIIEISNTGRELNQEELLNIFRPFYRIAQDVKGTGLGLALSKKIIEKQKGTITALNESDGLMVKIELPFA